MEEALPAFSAGVISTIICNPLDTLRINYQINNRLVFSFTKGLGYGLLAIPSFWTVYFPVYKSTKETLGNSISAYFACCLGSTISTPFWILRQKAQTGKRHSFVNTPIKNYYNGILTTYLINLSFAVHMPVYEFIKNKIENNTFNIFLATSFSKTFAACIFYPLDTIRAKFRNGDTIRGLKPLDFYKGLSIYLIRSIPYHCSVFCTYEFIKKRM